MSPDKPAHTMAPQKRPSYAPDGWARCPRCNRLIRENTECGCDEKVQRPYVQKPPEDRQEEIVRLDVVCPLCGKNYKVIKGHGSWMHDCMDDRKCKRCGRRFKPAKPGLRPNYCPECSAEKERERSYERRRSAKNDE